MHSPGHRVAAFLRRLFSAGVALATGKYRGLVWAVLAAGFLFVGFVAWVGTQRSPATAAVIAKAIHLIHGKTRPIAMAGEDHSVVPLPANFRTDDPLAATVAAVKDRLAKDPAAITATNVKRGDYLKLVEKVVKHFQPYQNGHGSIIDPFEGREIQYATPSYALAAATLVVSGKDPQLLESASKALDSALYQLASSRVTDAHGDFFITPAVMTYRLLKDKVAPATRDRWEKYLRAIDPNIAYSDLIGPGQPNVMNWNTSAILGEYLRHKEGFTDDAFVNRYLDAQIIRFTPEGLYRDPAVPFAYDASARFNFLVLLDEGYDGPHRADLETLLTRGAWVSLLMQSPAGDMPTGGRSADHVWTDALQCAAFERWAQRMQAAGDEVGAHAFKRAAHLAAGVMERWMSPSGAFWIVKNRFDPALRRGYETYSYQSQYNLLAAAYLALAWADADDSIAEGPAPADVGGFVADLPAFHKIFANSRGTYVEIETGADPHYNSTGLLRAESDGSGVLGLMDNAPIDETPLALGVGWQSLGERHSLAGVPGDRVKATLDSTDISPDTVKFAVTYQLDNAGLQGVTESYTLTKDSMATTATLDGAVDSWFVTFPAFISDGRDTSENDFDGNKVTMHLGKWQQTFEITAPEDAHLKRLGHIVKLRTGDYEVAEAQGQGNSVSYVLHAPVRAPTEPRTPSEPPQQ